MKNFRWAISAPLTVLIVYACFAGNIARTTVLASAAQAPTADAGQQVFEKRCSGCHTATRAKEGPPLAGVVGRKAASVAGFPYSDALKASNIAWDKASIELWLTDPEKMVPDTDMSLKVASPQERAALVEYLSVLK